MPDSEKFELQKEKRPGFILCKIERELSERSHVSLNTCRFGQEFFHLSSVAQRMVFNESQKYVFLTLEMGVDRAFRPAGESSDLPQFGAFVPISHKNLV